MSAERPSVYIAVAYSGGRDSTALLHATACAARDVPGLQVHALHVHHGLSAHADAWLRHCADTCALWAEAGMPVQFQHRRVTLAQGEGDSLEALARRARYQALAEMAHNVGADAILLAHHRQDQAETFLLQALRGAGVAGLAAMPVQAHRHGLHWMRPWLAHTREAIEAYVAHHALCHIEDDSNTDLRFTRNRLRLAVLPALRESFPQAEASLCAATQRAADAMEVVAEWAKSLMPQLCNEQGDLVVSEWVALSPALRRESLRHWYGQRVRRALPATWLLRLADELPALHEAGRSTHWAPIALGLYRGVLCRIEPEVISGLDQQAGQFGDPALPSIALPQWGGVLVFDRVSGRGLRLADAQSIKVHARSGGEQFQLGPNRPARTLKKQFQAMGVPAWRREAPVFYVGEQVAFVPGLGVDARCWAHPDEVQWGPRWVPDAASDAVS